MPRTHYYLIASAPTSVAIAMDAAVLAFVEAHSTAKTNFDTPELGVRTDESDPTRKLVSLHLHATKIEKPKVTREAIMKLFESFKVAGAELIESRTDVDGRNDEDLFEERPDLKRRRQGEAVPEPMKIQRDKAIARDLEGQAMIIRLKEEAAAAARELEKEVAARKSAETARDRAQGERETLAAAHRSEVNAYVDLIAVVAPWVAELRKSGATIPDRVLEAVGPFLPPPAE